MYPKTFFASGDVRQRSGKCFVIMPFAPKFDEVYATIKETLEGPELSLNCSRADEITGSGQIIEDVLREIAEAEIVIADLTGRNPNVFYELGIAQMVKDVDNVILLSEDDDSIPFDVKAFRCIIYQQSFRGTKKLQEKLVAFVKAAIGNSFRFHLLEGDTYRSERVMGPDRCAYEFMMSESMRVAGGAKFNLQITRYVVGEPPAIAFNAPCGLFADERFSFQVLNGNSSLRALPEMMLHLLCGQEHRAREGWPFHAIRLYRS